MAAICPWAFSCSSQRRHALCYEVRCVPVRLQFPTFTSSSHLEVVLVFVSSGGIKSFSQFTTSALSNKPPCCCGYYSYRCCMKVCVGLFELEPFDYICHGCHPAYIQCCTDIGGYTVKHDAFHPGHNYGRINVGSPATGSSEVSFSIVTAKAVLCNTRGCLYC
jgi:hypothetical protein